MQTITHSHPIVCVNDKCIIPMNEILKNKKSNADDGLHTSSNLKRFEHMGIPMVLSRKHVRYVSPDDDEIIESYERTMLPEDIYDELFQKVIDDKVTPAKKSKASNKSKRKVQKGARKTKRK
jgi:hypothetical protein